MKNFDYPPEFENDIFLAIENFYAALNDAVDTHTRAHYYEGEALDDAVMFMMRKFRIYEHGDDLNEMADGLVKEYDLRFGEVEEMARYKEFNHV